jgi:D-amino-acid dehydrogenase
MKIAIVGAGISGIMAAYYLVKAGHNITVIDQERYAAMRTSYANGGQVSVSNSEVWNTWSNVKKGIKWMLRKDAPLLVRPTLEWAKIKWMTKFLYHTIRGDYAKNTSETIQLGLESRKLYQTLIKDEGIANFDQSNCGILHFYKDQQYFDAAVQVKDLYESNGCEWIIMDAQTVAATDPMLMASGVVGGAWTAGDWVGDMHKFCHQLCKLLNEKYGVEFHYDYKLNGLESLTMQYDAVVVSAGVGSVDLASSIGDVLPIYPIKGYSITINNVDPKLLPRTSLLDDQAKIVASPLGNRLRVAGTAELTGENYDIRRDRIEPLLNWVHENLPQINTDDYQSWACLRPMTPNMMPIVQQSQTDSRVFYHTGHGHLGWTVSPATAKQLTHLIETAII